MSQYKIAAGTGQHIGDRKEQQDRVGLFTSPNAPGFMMAVVADGMGGRSGGAIAADQVVQTAKQLFEQFSSKDNVKQLLLTLMNEAHTVIKLSAVSSEKEPHSTFICLVISPERKAFWGYAGDSRLYRFKGPNFVDRTIDHSYVEKLVSEGKLSRDEAKNHRLSNILVNVLGSSVAPPYMTYGEYHNLEANDHFLLCSDGLWHYFTDQELSAAVGANSPRQAAELLIEKVRSRAGGRGDNCTFAIIKLDSVEVENKSYVAEKLRRAV